MLLISPPLSPDEWVTSRIDDERFRWQFAHYCYRYINAVLSLPKPQLVKIWRELCRGMHNCDVGPELLHVIVERELSEEEFEATSKLAKLIVLCALTPAIERKTIQLGAKTKELLIKCQQFIPWVLMVAVQDHFGMLQPASPPFLN